MNAALALLKTKSFLLLGMHCKTPQEQDLTFEHGSGHTRLMGGPYKKTTTKKKTI